ncbi:MAG TPA: UDP-2,3-diacylglucosamine diphosphatase LpxI [Myxococcaceae bacterium]|nr:UDP-2,3-diacylglucosamine diphosphatase LpxI [Myxococcaceae bacterium]
MEKVGLIAGNGLLPGLFAEAAAARKVAVVAVAHRGETDPRLANLVAELHWVRVGQVGRILRYLRAAGVQRAVMAGGFKRVRAWRELRPDLGALKVVAGLKSFRDDALLRAIARFFEEGGVTIGAPTEWLPEILAPSGLLAGAPLTRVQQSDVRLGIEVATLLGRADVGQTAVVKGGHVLALEAVEGTDGAIRRGAELGGPGVVVVKLSKPGQDPRFDLPAVGPSTVETLRVAGARVLAVEAGRTLILDAAGTFRAAERAALSIVGVSRMDDAALLENPA